MEDILSSIKRIIAEDSEAALSPPRAKRSVGLSPMTPAAPSTEPEGTEESNDDNDILELTDAVAAEPEAAAPAPQVQEQPMPKSAVAEQPVAAPVAAPVTQAKPAAEKPKTESTKPALVSPGTAEASRSSLAALSALIVKPEVTGSDTLEGLVREMLKPMLAEWLDARLPDVVDRLVAEEIARITARGI